MSDSKSPNPPDRSKNQKQGTTTRRTFLKSVGLASAGVAALNVFDEASAAQNNGAGASAVGPDSVPLRLKINGQMHNVKVEPRATLAEVLRDELHMTGTKVVCDRGSCSACTVMLAKNPVCSCMTLAIDVGDRDITTVEGLASGDNLHPVQAAFVAHDALQCGFCTSGMVMSCAALLERNSHPAIADIKTAISGNICRCGTYPKVFEAVLTASGRKGA
jgi:aerobic-type carbon monoxide dehydrogenase small subunit (CoxS/CutS family)